MIIVIISYNARKFWSWKAIPILSTLVSNVIWHGDEVHKLQQSYPPLLLHVTSSNDNDNDNASNNNDNNCNSVYYTNGYNDLIIKIKIIVFILYKDNDIYNNYDNYNVTFKITMSTVKNDNNIIIYLL